MITWTTLATLVVLLAAGDLAVVLCGAHHGRGRLERAALAALAGLTLLAFLVTALGLAGPLGRGAVLGIAGLALVGRLALRLLGRDRAEVPPGPPADEPWTAWQRAGLGLVLGFSAFAAFYAASMPVHIFDPIFHFAYKGKLLLHEGLLADSWTDVEGPVGRVITHPDYPPGVGALEAFVSVLAGRFDEDATRPLFALFALAVTAVLWARLRRLGRTVAVTGALLWSSLPFLFYSRLPHLEPGKGLVGILVGSDVAEGWFGSTGKALDKWSRPDGWTLDGAGDLPLAALFSVGFLLLAGHLARPAGERRRGEVVLAGLLLGGGALVKNEGLALLAVAALALVLGEAARRLLVRDRAHAPLAGTGLDLVLALAVTLVVAGPWLAVRGDVPTIGEDYPSRLSPTGLTEAWGSRQLILTDLSSAEPPSERVPLIVLGGFVDATTSLPRFGLVWPLFALALVLGLLRPRAMAAGPALAAALCVVGAFALYALVLLVTPWNLSHLFKTAIPDRLILHVLPLAVWTTCLVLGPAPEPEVEAAAEPAPAPAPDADA